LELVLIVGFLLIVYLLGEHAGRESPTRSKQLQEIVKAEADLKNLKTNLHHTTTSPWAHWIAILLLLIVVFWVFGGFRDDGYREYRRFR
jgi:amino acid transporter